MQWWELKFTVGQEAADAAAAGLHEWPEVQGVAIEGTGADAPLHPEYGEWFDESLLTTGPATLTVYVPEDVTQEDIRTRLNVLFERLKESGLMDSAENPDVTLTSLDEEEWDSVWKQDFHPIPIGSRFVVVPRWETELADDLKDRLAIVLEPGQAFGTGTHQTTQLCLEALELVQPSGKHVVDIGCGTAVLSIGAAKLGASRVTAIDIDPVAVRVAVDNVRDNRVEDVVHVEEGDLLNGYHPLPCDVAVANILRDPVLALTPQVGEVLRPGGWYIASGFVEPHQQQVEGAMRQAGFDIQRVLQRDDWLAIVAVKRP